MNDLHLIGAALSPLLIVMFAAEMSSSERAYNAGLMSELQMSARTLYSMLKLPFCIVAPMLFRCAFIGIILAAALMLTSIIFYIREQWSLSIHDRTWSETDDVQLYDSDGLDP